MIFKLFLLQITLLCSVGCSVLSEFRLNKSIDCKCRVQSEQRIVNSRISHHLAFPFYASLSYNRFKMSNRNLKKFLPNSVKMSGLACSATILNRKFLITSASCIAPKTDHLTIGFGNDLIKQFDEDHMPIKRIILHPKLADASIRDFNHNLALIELVSPINFSSSISPVCLTSKQENEYSSATLLAAGWGSIDDQVFLSLNDNYKSRFLKEIDLVLSQNVEKCSLYPKLLCTQSLKKDDKLVFNDLGGSVLWTTNGKSYAISVLSHLDLEIDKNSETAHFTNVSYSNKIFDSIDWIEKYIGDDYCSDK